jgi:hypothetical protein
MDAARLARAVHLSVEEVGPGRYVVTGGAEPHVVTIGEGGGFACDCRDAAVHGVALGCKHVLAVRLRLADGDVLASLREVVAMPKRSKRKARN